MTDKEKRGGPGRGQGRKPIAGDAPSVVFTMRMTHEQRVKLLSLGGAAWVRAQIEEVRFFSRYLNGKYSAFPIETAQSRKQRAHKS